jgi:hypothetical protein
MGRYYNGDIDGKFMFGVQSSYAADRFGSEAYTGYVQYYFNKEHLDTINEELQKLKEAHDKVAKFIENRDTWNNKERYKAGLTEQDMSDYADYVLGKKIKDCIIKQGHCYFDAEL